MAQGWGAWPITEAALQRSRTVFPFRPIASVAGGGKPVETRPNVGMKGEIVKVPERRSRIKFCPVADFRFG